METMGVHRSVNKNKKQHEIIFLFDKDVNATGQDIVPPQQGEWEIDTIKVTKCHYDYYYY